GQVELGRLLGDRPYREARLQQVAGDGTGRREVRPAPGVGDQQGVPAHPAATSATRSGSGGTASRRSHRKNSTFPDGPGSGLRTTPAVPQPSSPAACATSS